MSKFGYLFGTAMIATLCGMVQIAQAGSAITLQSDQTQLVALTAEAGTVVVGNPSIADVSVNGKQVFLHGRAFGETNIMILDGNGNQMANFDVSVTHDSANEVAIYSASSSPQAPAHRVTLNCMPNCQRVMMAGDDESNFKSMTNAFTAKNQMAIGSKSNDVAAPPAAASPQ